MAPKRRGNKVVGSVVKTKTKVVQETVEVIVAAADDDSAADQAEPQQVTPEALAVARPAVMNVVSGGGSGSRVVHVVEVTTPDGGDSNSNAKQQQPSSKRGRGRREEAEKQKPTPTPPPPEDSLSAPVPQSQETQDPNEEHQQEDDDDDDASKKKKKQKQQQDDDEHEEQQPETPRVASERKAAAATKPKPMSQQQKRKARRRRLGEGDGGMMGGYRRYLWRVLKQVHPDLGVSGQAMQVLEMMMADMFERLAEEAARLAKAAGKVTLTSREVQSAVRLVLPGELAKHAVSEGNKAISKYMSYHDV